MDIDAVRLEAPATPSAPALVLRPWSLADAYDLVAAHQDDFLRRWMTDPVDDAAGAERWLKEQRHAWETGARYTFAVVDTEATDGWLMGHVVLKRPDPDGPSAEVGYWTAAHARGRGVAPRALQALTDWAFTAFAADGLTRLELLHRGDNTASCRVAEKCGYGFSALLPAVPPEFPQAGHLHVRVRGAGGAARVG